MGHDDIDDHEDFVSLHGPSLQEFALQLSGDPSAASDLVDGALADVWSDRSRVDRSDWPSHARERVARRWASQQLWPSSAALSATRDHGPLSVGATPGAAADASELRSRGRALARRRLALTAVAAGSVAFLGAVAQTFRKAGAAQRVLLGDTVVEVSNPLVEGGRVVQVVHQGDLMAEFRETRDRPLVALTPLPDGRELVAVWLRPEVTVVDVANAGSDPISATTLVPLQGGTLALTVGRSPGRLPELAYLTPSGYRTEPPSVPQAIIGWGPYAVTGYFAPRQGVFVLQAPHREVLQGRTENDATVFLTRLGESAQLVVVHSWSLVAASLQRSGRAVESVDQVFSSGALVCAVLEPPASPDDPVDITVSTPEGTKTIRVEG